MPYIDWGNQLEDNVYKIELKWPGKLVGSGATWKTPIMILYTCAHLHREDLKIQTLSHTNVRQLRHYHKSTELNWSTIWESNFLAAGWIESRTQDVLYPLDRFQSFTNTRFFFSPLRDSISLYCKYAPLETFVPLFGLNLMLSSAFLKCLLPM